MVILTVRSSNQKFVLLKHLLEIKLDLTQKHFFCYFEIFYSFLYRTKMNNLKNMYYKELERSGTVSIGSQAIRKLIISRIIISKNYTEICISNIIAIIKHEF